MKASDIKPCPFCGAEPVVDRWFAPYRPVLYTVQCTNINCPVKPSTDYCKDRGFIIRMWNRRVTDENA